MSVRKNSIRNFYKHCATIFRIWTFFAHPHHHNTATNKHTSSTRKKINFFHSWPYDNNLNFLRNFCRTPLELFTHFLGILKTLRHFAPTLVFHSSITSFSKTNKLLISIIRNSLQYVFHGKIFAFPNHFFLDFVPTLVECIDKSISTAQIMLVIGTLF